MRKRLLPTLVLTVMALIISGCYHMRVNPEPLPLHTIATNKSSRAAVSIIKRILESELNVRMLDEEGNGKLLISAPWHFATDNGFGMPAGGRFYYVQLRLDISTENNHCIITLSPYNYELRTSYAYGLDGQVKTLYKIYPYPEYPGMFELSFLEQELKKIATMLESSLKDLQ